MFKGLDVDVAWKAGKVPQDRQTWVVVRIKKMDKCVCSSYGGGGGITLLPLLGKPMPAF